MYCKQKIKQIVFIISSLKGGGAERVVSLLANLFIREYSVTIILLSNEEVFYKLNKNIKIVKLDLSKKSNSICSKVLNNYHRINKLKNAIKQEKADIVISFMTQTNILSIIATKSIGKKILISERTNYNFLKSKIWIFLRKFIYRFSDALIVQSDYDKNKYNFHKNIKVIFNPLKILPIKRERDNIILAVGRVDYLKGYDRLINIYSKLSTDWKLIIVGEGNQRKNIESLISELNLEGRVILEGRKNNIEEYYARAKIFALSSRMEGFPNVLAEAMGHGCACIAFDCLTGPRDIIDDGINGYLVEDSNMEKYQIQLQKLVDNSDLRTKFSKEAKKIVERLDIDKISNEWLKIIQNITDKE